MTFDFKTPEYGPVWERRIEVLARIRGNPGALPALRSHYQKNPAFFINDWGTTADPRNAERFLPTSMPFVLWPKQYEFVDWTVARWRAGESGLVEKSRDSGATWLAVALACTLCLFNRGIVAGFGSRKQEYIDQIGAPKCIFEKIRSFMSALPPEFTEGWSRDKHAPFMRITFPGTGSAITGESGDGIGRGDRTSIYFVDEAAFLEHPETADASLSATTNCRIDISTPNGMANPFAIKRHNGKIKVFTFNWRDDPRKDDVWYRKQAEQLDPVSLAAEVDINYRASVEGVLIPSEWVNAAVDAHKKLGIEPTGWRRAGLDVADEGIDRNAIALRHGIVLEHVESWSGKGSDLYATVVKAFDVCDLRGYEFLFYDGDGMGSGVRGDARIINEARESDSRPKICDEPFRGSGAVFNPDAEMVPKRKNKDFFANAKAMAWWSLRRRFEATWRAVVKGLPGYDPDSLISIPADLPELNTLLMELSQPTYSLNSSGKVLVDKAPDGARSPNIADSVMIAFNPGSHTIETWMRL